MTNVNLRAVLRIKAMARDAASVGSVHSSTVGDELARTYERLRLEARALNTRAGWGDDDSFDRELPSIPRHFLPEASLFPSVPDDAVPAGQRALVLLGQLASWAEGHQEAFELEARFQADAEAKVKAAAAEANAASKPPLGFGG